MTYSEWKKIPHKDWTTEPIDPVCQVLVGMDRGKKTHVFCDAPTAKVYPAMGNGWMSLCAAHGRKHKEAFDVYEVIASGEQWS